MTDNKDLSLLEPLSGIVGDEHVLTGDRLNQRNPGYCDTSQQGVCLVRPSSLVELSAIAAFAHDNEYALVPQGD